MQVNSTYPYSPITGYIQVDDPVVIPPYTITTTSGSSWTDDIARYRAGNGGIIGTKKEKNVELNKSVGILVSLTTASTEMYLGVALSISAVYGLMGLWVEDDEELDDALESLFNKTPRPGKDEKWVDAFAKPTAIGTYLFNRIVVAEGMNDD